MYAIHRSLRVHLKTYTIFAALLGVNLHLCSQRPVPATTFSLRPMPQFEISVATCSEKDLAWVAPLVVVAF